MKNLCFKLLLLAIVLVVSTTNSFAQYEWTKYPENPINIHGSPGSWNESVIAPCVIFNSDLNRYEMWFTALWNYPNEGIGFAYSNDGKTWTVYPDPVMRPSTVGWDSLFVGAVSIIKESGTYKMWYTGWKHISGYPHSIGYATSLDGIIWEKCSDNPVLTPLSDWESGAVGYPSVVKVADEYLMFYTGEVSNGVSLTGRATSTDGINWERYSNNPVLPAGGVGQWDRNNYLAKVIFLNDSLYMYYTGQSNPGVSGNAIGLATSADSGKTWTKYFGNPILKTGEIGIWDYGWIETGSVLFAQNELKLYYDGSGPAVGNKGRIGLAISSPLPAGTYTIGAGGNFATIQEAFDTLEADGIAGPVTFELIDDLYTAPTDSLGYFLNGPIPGAGETRRAIIKPAENKNVVIEGAGRCVLYFLNTSYLTLDGVDISGSTTLTIHGLHGQQYAWKSGAEFRNNSDYNVVQNVIFIQEDINYDTDGTGFWTGWGSETADNNIIQNNFIKRAGIGIVVAGKNQYTKATSVIIRGNKIGSETDSLITMGIGAWALQNSIIEDNIVQNLRQHFQVFGEMILTPAIELAFSNNSIIRNNVVHNVKAISLQGSAGIWVAGDAANGYGNDNMVYNNMVYDIQSTSIQYDSRVSGIQLWYQNNPKVFYNSVYLSGIGTNKYGSAALYITSNVTNADIKNNIFVNTRDESPYCASAIYDFSASNLTTDYNDLYYEPNQYNCLVRIGSNDYQTLADWQATGQDINSITEMPNFKDPYLHLDETIGTYLESGATPISGIDTDFDGELRNASTPDIGADEFNGFTSVELTSFAASVNGKEVMLNWSTATEINNRGFEIQRSTEGAEFLTVGFVKGHGTTTEQQNYNYADRNLDNGKYYYRLKQIDYDGSYEYSVVVEVEMTAFNSYLLEQNYPNPFNPATTIGFGIQNKSNVKITILNVIGEEVAVVLNEERQAGYYQIEFNAAGLSSGVYFYRIKAENFIQTKKMILLR